MDDAKLFWCRVSDKDCQNALRQQHSHLVENLDPSEIIAGLFSASVLSQYAKEEVEGQRTRSAVCDALLMKVKQRGKEAFNIFARLLKENQGHLFEKLVLSLPKYPGRDAYMTQDSDSALLPAERAPQVKTNNSVPMEIDPTHIDTPSRQTVNLVNSSVDGSTRSSAGLFAAVLLYLSVQRTHFELHVLFDKRREELHHKLIAWQQESNQEHARLPEPQVVSAFVNGTTASSFVIDEPVHISVTNRAGCSHGCLPLVNQKHRWLVDLGSQRQEEQDSLTVKFWRTSDEAHLCTFHIEHLGAFKGHHVLASLGFSAANQPNCEQDKNEALRCRPKDQNNTLSSKALRTVSNFAQSVGLIYGQHSGFVGTGFCVGTEQKRYIMTCHHVYADERLQRAITAGEAFIRFGDMVLHEEKGASFKIKFCKDFDNLDVYNIFKLDVAVLSIEDLESQIKPPLLIPCNIERFEQLMDKKRGLHYLTLIGYLDSHKRIIDTSAEWLPPGKELIAVVRQECDRRWPNNPQYKDDYDFRESELHYHVVVHEHGSSGSPVFYCSAVDDKVTLVGMHSRGLPKFFYNKSFKGSLEENLRIEAGERMSKIYESLAGNSALQSAIFSTCPTSQ